MKLIKTLILIFILAIAHQSVGAFEVKGEAVSTTLCVQGKCETDACNDEVIYEVDTKSSKVIRKAVVNKGINHLPTSLRGLQVDNTIYNIVFDDKTAIGHDEKSIPIPGSQRVIKAIGQTGWIDGFEIVVIGEYFIHTCRSSNDYFVIYYYKRVRYP